MKKIIREQREKTQKKKTIGNEDNHKRNEEQHAKRKRT